jgi:GT2 family glycosyltransferase
MAECWVVVLNWNGADDTIRCVESLRTVKPPPTVLVVDNGSTDGSPRRIRAAAGGIRVLELPRNLGYCGGNNAGIKAALEAGAEAVAVLNNDTVVTPTFLEPLLARLREADTAVALSPVIRYLHDPQRAWFSGGVIDWPHGMPHHLPVDRRIPERPFSSAILTGCCLLAAAATWRHVGCFDERFFLLFEDSDWSARAVRAGVALEVVPESVIFHAVSGSLRDEVARGLATFYFLRNGLLFNWLHQSHWMVPASRFLWRWGIRPAAGEIRRRRDGRLINLALRSAAVYAFVRRRWGPAPSWVAQLILRARAGAPVPYTAPEPPATPYCPPRQDAGDRATQARL